MVSANLSQPNDTAVVAQEFLSGKLAHVDVAGVEKELKQLWKKAETDGSQSPSTVTRACSFNIILMSNQADAETVCNDLLDEVLVHRPGRGILAIYRPELPHRLDAWVSARCHLEGNKKQICAEQITVCCEGGQPKELASVVLPLVIADLPVFLYWRAQLPDEESLVVIAKSCNRMITDSLREPFNHEQLGSVSKIINTWHQHLFVSDLNWRRLSGWMRAFADAFDGFPMPKLYLWKFSKITIASVADSATACDSTAGGAQSISTQSLLLIGWLATRLGWTPTKTLTADKSSADRCSTKQSTIEFKSGDGRTVTVVFTAGRGQETGHVVQVDCEFDDGKAMSVASKNENELSYVTAQARDVDHKEATRADYDLSESALLEQELSNLQRYDIYESAVHMAAMLIS